MAPRELRVVAESADPGLAAAENERLLLDRNAKPRRRALEDLKRRPSPARGGRALDERLGQRADH
jgi:hypothetical protein